MKQNDSVAIGKRIRNLREQKGLSQKELAGLLQISQGRVSQIERSGNIPDNMLSSLCIILKVESDYLLAGEPSTKSDSACVYLDSGENYDNAVKNMLREYGYKKINHPIAPFSCDMTEVKTTPAFKAISKILRDNDSTLTIESKAIYDEDCIAGTKTLIYPSITYTFALRCLYLGIGYRFEAFETSRVANDNIEKDSSEFEHIKKQFGACFKPLPDQVDFTPYHFALFSPIDGIYAFDGEEGKEAKYYGHYEEMYRYRTAVEKAHFNAHTPPKDIYDSYWIDKYCPSKIIYDKNDLIDRNNEFIRFKDLIYRGVSGKSLETSGKKERFYPGAANTLLFSGMSHTLNSMGEIRIDTKNGKVEIEIDDRTITGEQFLSLLTCYEGWKMRFEMLSD